MFAQEREEIKKKRKLNPQTGMISLTSADSDTSPTHHSESGSEPNLSQSLECNLAAEQLPSIKNIPVSPTATTPFRPSIKENKSTLPETSNVILRRHKFAHQTTLSAKFDDLSPVCGEKWRRPPSNELPGL